MRAGEPAGDRGTAAAGLLGVLTDRRGEAHLWLALEDSLAQARTANGAADAVWEIRRRFVAVADALVAVSAIDRHRASSIAAELDDALAVRGIVSPGGFQGRASSPARAADTERRVPTQPGDGWLEAEIEHHLDLVVDLRADAHPGVGDQVLANLRPPARALLAVGALDSLRRLDDLAATLRAAGYPVDEARTTAAAEGDVDRGWLSFLRAKPRPPSSDLDGAAERLVAVDVGSVAGGPVTLVRVAWNADALELEIAAPPTAAAGEVWRASAYDDTGQLHLGQAGQRRNNPASNLSFRLRPGLRSSARSFALRVTHQWTRLDERVTL